MELLTPLNHPWEMERRKDASSFFEGIVVKISVTLEKLR
jgi:hypothetical protein